MNSVDLKRVLAPYFDAAETFEQATVEAALRDAFDPSVDVKMCHPFGALSGPDAFSRTCLAPLHAALPDLERR
ncbi:MAG: polyketide cyclase, partial [Pseudomonadota bacterium]